MQLPIHKIFQADIPNIRPGTPKQSLTPSVPGRHCLAGRCLPKRPLLLLLGLGLAAAWQGMGAATPVTEIIASYQVGASSSYTEGAQTRGRAVSGSQQGPHRHRL